MAGFPDQGCFVVCCREGRLVRTNAASNVDACLRLICVHRGLNVHTDVTKAACVAACVVMWRPLRCMEDSLVEAFCMVF